MFYDERIEKVKGRISRNAIIMSVIISVVLGSIRLTNILKNTNQIKYLCLVILEAMIFLSGLICLLIGFIRSRIHTKDERTIFEESHFYNKASSILIKIVTIIFAFFLPVISHIELPDFYVDSGFGNIFSVLFFSIGTYFIYKLKSNDIYFNYSLMEDEHYYKSVFKNIWKFAFYILCLFGVSAISFIFFVVTKELNQTILVKHILQIIGLYTSVMLGFSLLYLLYSFLEKMSYNSTRWLSKSTIISLGITVFIYAVYTLIVVFANSLASSQTQAMQTVSLVSYLGFCINFALLIFLTYFGYEYLKVKQNKLLAFACLMILLSEVSVFLIGHVWNEIRYLFLREMIEYGTYTITYFLSTAKTIIQDLSSIINTIGFSLIIIALIKDTTIGKSNIAMIFGFVVLGGIEMFLRTQTGYLEVNIYHSFSEIAVLIYFCILITCIERKQINETL